MRRTSWIGMVSLGVVLATNAAYAEEPVTTAVAVPAETAAPLDREGKPIYGYEIMTESEISGLTSLLFSIKDPKARDEARAAHHKAMDKRAAERGVKLKQ